MVSLLEVAKEGVSSDDDIRRTTAHPARRNRQIGRVIVRGAGGRILAAAERVEAGTRAAEEVGVIEFHLEQPGAIGGSPGFQQENCQRFRQTSLTLAPNQPPTRTRLRMT
jgi:hypothetical protein